MGGEIRRDFDYGSTFLGALNALATGGRSPAPPPSRAAACAPCVFIVVKPPQRHFGKGTGGAADHLVFKMGPQRPPDLFRGGDAAVGGVIRPDYQRVDRDALQQGGVIGHVTRARPGVGAPVSGYVQGAFPAASLRLQQPRPPEQHGGAQGGGGIGRAAGRGLQPGGNGAQGDLVRDLGPIDQQALVFRTAPFEHRQADRQPGQAQQSLPYIRMKQGGGQSVELHPVFFGIDRS